MPNRVEDVRLRIDRVCLADVAGVSPLDSGSILDESLGFREGVGGEDDSAEVGATSKGRRALGRRRVVDSSVMVED